MADAPPGATTGGFAAHDFSRKFVEFQMAQALMASGNSTSTSVEQPAPPAPFIPPWMQTGRASYRSPATFATGCGWGAYRPTGFLKIAAEMRRAQMFATMSQVACEYGIPVGLFDAMIIRESGYQANILSPKSAYGLTQLMPGTAAQLGVNPYDPMQNLRGGARYLRAQLDRFGQFHLALAAYNAGPERVRNGVIPAIGETQAYVADILQNWRRLTSTSMSITTPVTRAVPIAMRATRPGGYRVVANGSLIGRVRIASISRF